MIKQLTAALTALALLFTQGLLVPAAHAAMITTDGLIANEQRAALERKVMRLTERDAAAKVLARNGVTPKDVEKRLNRLSNQELRKLADKADQIPAGGSVLGVVLAVILILVLLDLLGATNVFPAI